jgi:CubicO group peptidase (beta-lactamase class C family)
MAFWKAGRVAGTSWEAVIRELVFAPLRMTTADLSATDLPMSADFHGVQRCSWRGLQ